MLCFFNHDKFFKNEDPKLYSQPIKQISGARGLRGVYLNNFPGDFQTYTKVWEELTLAFPSHRVLFAYIFSFNIHINSVGRYYYNHYFANKETEAQRS